MGTAALAAGFDLVRRALPGPMMPAGETPAAAATFPAGPIATAVELYVGTSWLDITDYVYARNQIAVIRGRADEATLVDASIVRLTLNNRDGRFSPRNPAGPWYGLIGRNTPIRASIAQGSTRLLLDSSAGSYAYAPDTAGLSVTGDVDVRIDLLLSSWRASTQLIFKDNAATSWYLELDSSGLLVFGWSANGSTVLTATSTVAVPAPASGRQALRVTLDVNNGAAGNTVTFYTSDSIAGAWTQLGSAVTAAGTTSIYDSTDPLVVAVDLDGCEVYAAKVLSGIGGTEVANPDLTVQAAGADQFMDAAGNVWSVPGPAALTNKRYRFRGEVSAWPVKWDTTGSDVYVPIEAAGILRRLGQGAAPIRSTMYRGLTTLSTAPVAYWPCEEANTATQIASGLGGPQMDVTGTPTLASYAWTGSTGFACSDALPTLSLAKFNGNVPTYTSPSPAAIQLRFLLAVPSGGAVNNGRIASLWVTGSTRHWDIVYGTGGTLTLNCYSDSGVSGAALLVTTGAVAFAVDGKRLRVSLELTQSGSDIAYAVETLEVGSSTGLAWTGTLSSQTLGRAASVTMNGNQLLDDVAVGHISVQQEVTSLFDLADELDAYDGETAGRRLERLCGDEGITFVARGDLDNTVEMGPQLPAALLDLLRECATADDGILYEPREVYALAYRTRASLYNRAATLALDYTAGQLDALEPTDDDQNVTNDVTVTRANGSSARATLASGALSIAAPPDGIGRYDSQVTVNVHSDSTLNDQASWRMYLGTVNEPRYPVIGLNLANPEYTGSAPLTSDAMSLDVGDRLTVTNLPSWLPPDDISQLAQGFTEVWDAFTYMIGVNCSPESGYQTGIVGNSRLTSGSSTLAAGADATATTLSVATSDSGDLWTTAGGDFPFDIVVAGERMTVTTISGASSPQTFTVTRSVNGVVKPQAAGATVTLFTPAVLSL